MSNCKPSHMILDLNALSENEVRSQFRKFNVELPLHFDFKQHSSIKICTQTRIVLKVVKLY